MSEQSLEMKSPPLQHLAIIMDGNGRWANKQGLPRIAGHHQGVQTVIQVVDECITAGIGYLSLFAFSSENWGRPRQEVDALMELLLQFLPDLTEAITSGALPATPEAILQARIQSALHPYVDACRRHAHTG